PHHRRPARKPPAGGRFRTGTGSATPVSGRPGAAGACCAVITFPGKPGVRTSGGTSSTSGIATDSGTSADSEPCDADPRRQALPYRLIATDLDGTLLRSDETISERSRAALAAAAE